VEVEKDSKKIQNQGCVCSFSRFGFKKVCSELLKFVSEQLKLTVRES